MKATIVEVGEREEIARQKEPSSTRTRKPHHYLGGHPWWKMGWVTRVPFALLESLPDFHSHNRSFTFFFPLLPLNIKRTWPPGLSLPHLYHTPYPRDKHDSLELPPLCLRTMSKGSPELRVQTLGQTPIRNTHYGASPNSMRSLQSSA